MKYIQGSDRKQTAIFPISMDMAIGGDNEVRIIEEVEISELGSYLREALPIFFAGIIAVRHKIMNSKLSGFLEIIEEQFIQHLPKRLIFAQNL